MTPVRETPVADACTLVQRRVASFLALMSARPNSTPVRAICGPLPADSWALRFLPPKVSKLTSRPVVASLTVGVDAVSAASLTVLLSERKAKSPLTRRKSPRTRLAPVTPTLRSPACRLAP